MSDDPTFQLEDQQVWISRWQERCTAASGGRLADFSSGSVLQVLAETQALAISDLQTQLNLIFPDMVAASLELLGFTRSPGARAVVDVRFQLEAVSAQAVPIPRGHRFSIAGSIFETLGDVLIPAGTDTADPARWQVCSVSAQAIATGSGGNQPQQAGQILQPFPGLLGIFMLRESRGGADLESYADFAARVQGLIAGAIGRDGDQGPLIQGSEFEAKARQILGSGSIAIAVPELSADRSSRAIAAMHLFVCNADGTAATAAQKRALSEAMGPRAVLAQGRLFFSDLSIVTVNVDVNITIAVTAGFDAIASEINSLMRQAFSLASTANMRSLRLYDAIALLKGISGIDDLILQWAIAPNLLEQARNLALPTLANLTTRTAPARIGRLSVILEPGGTRRDFNV